MAKVKQKYIVRWLFEVKIYALADFDDNVFYVGATTGRLKKRLSQHIKTSKPFSAFSRSPKATKIRELNYNIKIIQLDSIASFGVDCREAQLNAEQIELKWMKQYLDNGIKLSNRLRVNRKTA